MRGVLDVGFRFVEHINRLELDELVALMTGTLRDTEPKTKGSRS